MKANANYKTTAATLTMGMVLSAVIASADPAAAGIGNTGHRGPRMEMSTLESVYDGPWAKPVVIYAESAEQWDAAVAKLAAQGALLVGPGPQAPAVNWKKESVLLVALGPTRDSRSMVEVASLDGGNSELVVTADVQVSGHNPMGRSAHSPHHLVKLNKKAVLATVSGRALGRSDTDGLDLTVLYNYVREDGTPLRSGQAKVSSDGAWNAAPESQDEAQSVATTWGAMKGQYR